jgi:Trypsin-like peptidase domain
MTNSPLRPLPGTAPHGTWRIGTADRESADGRQAIFPILKRPTAASLSLLGTGFFLQPHGGFATAAHVALEAQDLLSDSPDSVGIARTLPNGRTRFLPIWKFFLHDTADVAFGIPRYEFVDEATGAPIRAKVLSLVSRSPAGGSPISTWSYPLHQVIGDEATGQTVQLQPDFYSGRLQEFFTDRGPSAKLKVPYYRTDIHLHGGSSGGSVFNFDGEVFGIASCSYEGATDLAFVTPAAALLQLETPARVTDVPDDGPRVSLRELAAHGQIVAR